MTRLREAQRINAELLFGGAVSGSEGREAVCQLDEGILYSVCLCVCARACKIAGSPDHICHRRMLSRF